MEIAPVPYDHDDARALICALQQEYVTRYGESDQNAVCVGEFVPPHGVFLVGYLDAAPTVCGGWRSRPGGVSESGVVAEVKRMYTAPWARGCGLARRMLTELEKQAARAGCVRVVLETGVRQPEALGLYAAAGYRDVVGFGHYRDDPESRFLGKEIGL